MQGLGWLLLAAAVAIAHGAGDASWKYDTYQQIPADVFHGWFDAYLAKDEQALDPMFPMSLFIEKMNLKDFDFPRFDAALFYATNYHRYKNGKKPLAHSVILEAAAFKQAKSMTIGGKNCAGVLYQPFFAHENANDGCMSTLQSRIFAAGDQKAFTAPAGTMGENLVKYYHEPNTYNMGTSGYFTGKMTFVATQVFAKDAGFPQAKAVPQGYWNGNASNGTCACRQMFLQPPTEGLSDLYCKIWAKFNIPCTHPDNMNVQPDIDALEVDEPQSDYARPVQGGADAPRAEDELDIVDDGTEMYEAASPLDHPGDAYPSAVELESPDDNDGLEDLGEFPEDDGEL